MFIRSTGLGRTLLCGKISSFVTTDVVPSTLEPASGARKEPLRLLVDMEITHPVHWTVRTFIDPADLREMLMMILTNPVLLFSCIKFLFMESPKYDDPAQAGMPEAVDAELSGDSAPAKAGTGMPPVGPGRIPSRRK
jgi:hypothetical protein